MGIIKSEDYLITTWVGETSRKFFWHGEEAQDLDLPLTWVLEKKGDKLYIRNSGLPTAGEQIADQLEFDAPQPGKKILVELPSLRKGGLNRPLDVEILRMKPLDPVFILRHQMAPNYTGRGPKQLMQFYGERYYLVRYRPVPPQRTIGDLFEYAKTPTGYSVLAKTHGIRIKTAAENITLPRAHRADLTEQAFFSATIIHGVHWWRFRMVPTPDSLPPLETEDTEDDVREELRFKQSALAFLIGLMLTLGMMYSKARNEKPAPKIIAQTEIKVPKIIPPTKEELKPPPPPPPEPKKPEPPKVVELKPEKKEEPKPEPKQKVAKKTPKPKKAEKVAKAKPAKSPEPPPPMPVAKVVTPEPPSAAEQAAAQKAEETAAMKQQLMKKLGFLGTSSKRAKVDPKDYEQKEGRFTDTPTVGGDVSKTTALDKIVKDAPGGGTIKTNSSRTVSSAVDFGKQKGKGLNDVQGKVSLGELHSAGAGLGDALGGSGLSISGTGQVTEPEIEKALAKYLQRFQFCYEKALLSDASLGGKVTVQWTIETSGKAKSPKVVSSQLNNADLHTCIGNVLKEIPFPKPKGGTVIVKKTFAFSSSSI
jgi:outer membrane biosynthesis protein TonB